jgi:hypothetical protein
MIFHSQRLHILIHYCQIKEVLPSSPLILPLSGNIFIKDGVPHVPKEDWNSKGGKPYFNAHLRLTKHIKEVKWYPQDHLPTAGSRPSLRSTYSSPLNNHFLLFICLIGLIITIISSFTWQRGFCESS